MKQKFKVELEIEVEYEPRPDGIDNAPYTQIAYNIEDDKIWLDTTIGKIINVETAKLERVEE